MSRAQRSASESSDAGAAQFVVNLSPRQLQHLQFSVPKKGEPERFSVFLEEPRQVPVPKRFTFDIEDLARAKVLERQQKEESAKHARKESAKSMPSGSEGSSSRYSVDFLKEVERVTRVDWRFYATGASLFVLNLVAAWDATTLPIALPTIATALGGSAFETFWLAIASLATATCFLPLFATLSDIFGRKAILLTSVTLFAVGSFIGAVTGNFTGLHLGRSIQGIGAGGIYALSSLIVSDLVTTVDTTKWRAILGASWAIGAITGPFIGGALAQRGQWRWIFWLNLPFCTVVFLVVAFCARLRSASPGAILDKLRNVDWLGFIVFSGSLISLLLGLTWGGTEYYWSDFRTVLAVTLGLFGLLSFMIWSWFSPCLSLVGLDVIADPRRLATYFGSTIHSAIVFAGLYFLPIYFSTAKRSNTLVQTAGSLCAWSVPLAAFALISFFIVTKTTMHRPLTWFAWFLVILGVALMTIFTREPATVMWVCIALFSGFGIGILYPSLSSLALSNLQSGTEDRVVTNLTFFQTLGQTLGVAVGSAVFRNELYKQLRKNPAFDRFALRYVKDAFELVIKVRDISGAEALKMQVADAYVDAIRIIWVVMAGLAGVAFVVSIFTMKPKLRRPEATGSKTVGVESTV